MISTRSSLDVNSFDSSMNASSLLSHIYPENSQKSMTFFQQGLHPKIISHFLHRSCLVWSKQGLWD
jgi:UDP-N-acetylglucosamine pyrophosphorylase